MADTNMPAEEITVEDAPRQASEADKPIETAETTEPEIVTPEKAEQTPIEGEEKQPEAELGVKMTPEQQKAFQRQRQEIKHLRDELATKERAKSAFEALKPPTVGPSMVRMPRAEDFMDVEGRIDIAGYQGAVQQYNESQSFRAQARDNELRYEMEQNFLKMKHPNLDPTSDQFDPDLEARVGDRYGRILLEAITQGKPEPSLLDVVNEVLKSTGVTPKEKERISQEVLDKVSEKEQAASIAQAPSTAPRARGTRMVSDFEELRQRTKEGDNEALAARIRAAEQGKK